MISNVSSSAIESFMHASPGFQALHFAMEADKSLAELPAISKVTARQITTMVQRLTYRRRHPYATRSNKTRVVKTPGGKNVIQYRQKRAGHRKCAVTRVRLQGLPAIRPRELSQKKLAKRHKSVNRVYGGHLAHNVVRERIIRAFLIEEQKIVKKVIKMKEEKDRASARTEKREVRAEGRLTAPKQL